MRVATWALALGASCALAACDKSPFADDPPPPPSEPPPRPRDHRGAPGENQPELSEGDAGIVIERSDPYGPSGDLRAEIDAFTNLDACVQQHAGLDPLVGDAVRALGYDTLLRDACRVLQSLKMKDTSPCAAIAASGLQQRCEGLVAMEIQQPDRCPWIAATERGLGRDPTCLAVATHDPRICAAAFMRERATCEALATGDEHRCRGLSGERAACEHELARDRRVLVAEEHEAHDAAMPKGKATLHGTNGGKDPEPSEIDLASALEPGIVVSPSPAGGLEIEVARDREAALHLPSRGTERVRFDAGLHVEAGKVKVERFAIDAPNVPPMSCPGSHCTITAEIPKGDPKRGGPMSITFDGTYDSLGATYSVHVQVDSYVRDVVTRTAMYMAR